MSFFGGDHSKSHWSVSLKFPGYNLRGEELKAAREQHKLNRQKLKDAGIKVEQYFQFTTSNKAAGARMKALAEKEAARIEKLTGLEMQVQEGFFL